MAKIVLVDTVSGDGIPNNASTAQTSAKAILDFKRRNDLVDEAFLEQKDILLDMLEAKLKEVRDKKKKKTDRVENNSIVAESIKCELLPNDVDLKLQASGIIAVGETDVQLKFGDLSNSNLNLNASGISNVGKTSLKLGIGDGTVNIPGLNNLFLGSTFLRGPCEKQQTEESKSEQKRDKVDANFDDTTFRKNLFSNNSLNINKAIASATTAKPLPTVVSLLQSSTQINPVTNIGDVQNVA